MSEHIKINNIYLESVWHNKKIIVSMILLLCAYYAQDVVFTQSLATATSNVPEFVKDISIQKMGILLFPYLVAVILFYISNVLYSHALPDIQLNSINSLVDLIIRSIKSSKKEINVSDILIHIKTFADGGEFYRVLMTGIFPTMIVVIGVMYNIMRADIKSGILVTIALIILIIITSNLEYNNIRASNNAEKSINTFYDEIHEILLNIDTIITSDTIQKEKESIQNIKNITANLSKSAKTDTSNTTTLMQLGSLSIVLLINYLSYRLYVKKLIGVPILVSNVMMSLLFMNRYNKMLDDIKNAMTETGALFELTQYFTDFKLHDPNIHAIHLDDFSFIGGDIVIKNVSLKRNNNQIFTNLNITIKGMNTTGIVGRIGSGKSSLMKIISGIVDYDGLITIDGQNIKKCNYESLMRHIAYIPQHPVLFNKSLYHNITYGVQITNKEVIDKLSDLKLFDFFTTFPQGMETIAGKNGNNLSGGQKQMIALIRSILQNKSILLLDEPTSSLDTKNKQLFLNLIKRLKNKTIIINTHDQDIMHVFAHVIRM